MSLPKQYLTGKHSDLEKYFTTIFSGQAPDKFTIKFLNDLGFTSSYDRQFIGVLKSLGFLDDAGIPTKRYFSALDQSNRNKLVSEGIKEAYKDLFLLDRNAQTMDLASVKGKFKTMTEGKLSDSTITNMAKTFHELCEYAEWSEQKSVQKQKENKLGKENESNKKTETDENMDSQEKEKTFSESNINFKYDIHIHLPDTRDSAVYDALFTSLKKHLIS